MPVAQPVDRHAKISSILIFGDNAEETVLFIGDAGGEEDTFWLWKEIPQPLELKRRSIQSHQRFQESAGGRIVVVNLSVPEISNPQLVTFNECEAPRRV